MYRFRLLGILGVFAAMTASPYSSKPLLAQKLMEIQYQVLSPWAEVDPMPLRGISPRIENLAGKKIGLFVNYKRAARPIGLSVEKRLKSMYPGSEIRTFSSPEWNVLETETNNREKFAAWAKESAAVILLVGD
jgi:hypothetical protein